MAPPGYYGDEDSAPHNSTPYPSPAPQPPPPPADPSGPHGSEANYGQTVMRPPMPPTTRRPDIDIEGAIAREVTEGIAESSTFGTSLLRGIKKYLVPLGTVMDIVSGVLRFMTLGFLLTLPEVYTNLFKPPAGVIQWQVAHYFVLGTSLLGIALGVPIAIFSSVYSLVTLFSKKEATNQITVARLYNKRVKYFNKKIRAAWGYILVAFLSAVVFSIPFFLQNDKRISPDLTRLLSEAAFIVVPFVCTIITMITERESGADGQERASHMGTNLAMYQTFQAGIRLAFGQGSFVDAASVRAAMNGDIASSIDAGVAEVPDEVYLTLAEIAVALGRSPAKDDPFRRTLNNVVQAAARTGKYGIKKDPVKGYMVPEKHFHKLFLKYLANRPAKVENGGNVTPIGSNWQGPRPSTGPIPGRNTVEKNVLVRIAEAIFPSRKSA